MLPSIQTHSGLYFDFENPQVEQVLIEDVAHALSNICRYNGHCAQFYSVAQHAVLVSHLVDEDHEWEAFHHDDGEAYTGDVPTPLKQLLPQFKKIEKRVEKTIAKKFGLPKKMTHEVKIGDLQALMIEKRCLLTIQNHWAILDGVPEPKIDHIIPLPPELAKKLYLDRYEELKAKHNKM